MSKRTFGAPGFMLAIKTRSIYRQELTQQTRNSRSIAAPKAHFKAPSKNRISCL